MSNGPSTRTSHGHLPTMVSVIFLVETVILAVVSTMALRTSGFDFVFALPFLAAAVTLYLLNVVCLSILLQRAIRSRLADSERWALALSLLVASLPAAYWVVNGLAVS